MFYCGVSFYNPYPVVVRQGEITNFRQTGNEIAVRYQPGSSFGIAVYFAVDAVWFYVGLSAIVCWAK